MKIIQISDTHLSAGKPHFVGNWAPLRDWVAEQRPDLVIHTGDVTVNGADQEDDLAFCAERCAEIGPRVLVAPGNHDVGQPGSHQPIVTERLQRWRQHFGPDHWLFDIPGWRLLGLNAMLFASGHPAEAEQDAWLAHAMQTAGQRRIAWFMHLPLFLEHPDEPDTGYWTIKPEPRRRLLDLVRRHEVALVGAGHLHKAHDLVMDGTRYVWCPAGSFVVGPGMQEEMPGEKFLGAVSLELAPDRLDVSVVHLNQLAVLWIDDVVHEVYPKPASQAQRPPN